ncbi:MAG: hypothetical protein ACI4GY_02900 [Acutalibacteraceae bacterium]
MKIFFAVIWLSLCALVVATEKVIFKAIDKKMNKNGAMYYNSHYAGYLILDTVLLFVLLFLLILRNL